MILDEPTAGVDIELRHELWRYIRRLHGQGTTILLTTHYLEEAEALCEEIALISGGRIVARDTRRRPEARATAPATLEEVYLKTVATGVALAADGRGRRERPAAAAAAESPALARAGGSAMRECHRVLRLWTQTTLAPVISSLLFIVVFGLSLGGRISRSTASTTRCSSSPG